VCYVLWSACFSVEELSSSDFNAAGKLLFMMTVIRRLFQE